MKTPATTKGKHPAQHTDVAGVSGNPIKPLRQWRMDSICQTNRVLDSWTDPGYVGGASINPAFFNALGGAVPPIGPILPRVVPSPVGDAWQLNYDLPGPNLTDLSTGLGITFGNMTSADVRGIIRDDENTVGLWFRLDGRTPTGDGIGVVLALGGREGDATNAQNILWRIDWDEDTGKLRYLHENNGPPVGTNVIVDIDNFVCDIHKWYYLVVTQSNKSGGTLDVDIFINGSLILHQAGLDIAESGTEAIWMLGCAYNSTVFPSPGFTRYQPMSVASVTVWKEALPASLIADDFRRGLLLDSFTTTDVQVLMPVQFLGSYATSAGFDFSDALNMDWLSSVSVDDGVDDPSSKASFSLHRLQERLNLSPFITDSLLNTVVPEAPYPIGSTYTPVLGLTTPYRFIEIRAARVPLGTQPINYQWQSLISGIIDTVDFGDNDLITVAMRDYGSALLNAYTETEIEYGSAGGTLIESVLQSMVTDNDSATLTGSYPPMTLITQGDPSWAVLPFKRKREPVFSGLRAVAEQLGWIVRFRFIQDPAINDWRLLLYEPARENFINRTGLIPSYFDGDPAVTLPISTAALTSFSKGTVSTERVRNVIRIAYPSSELAQGAITLPSGVVEDARGLGGIDNEGNRTPAFIQLSNTTSIGNYGRRFMEIQEDQSSQIDTIVEAARFSVAGLSDLFQPDLNATIECLSLFELDIGDVVATPPNDVWSTSEQIASSKGVAHRFGITNTTSLNVHGKPSVGFKTWAVKEARPGLGPPPVLGAGGLLTGREFATQLVGFEAIQQRTSYGAGGPFVQIRNPSFDTFSMGLANPPDGWTPVFSTWGVDIESSTISASGNRSIRLGVTPPLPGAGIEILGPENLVSIDGDPTTPYMATIVWQRDDALATDDSKIVLAFHWYEADRITPVAAAAAVLVANPDPSTNGEWQTSSAVNIRPPVTTPPALPARWLKVFAFRDDTLALSPGDLLVDNVSVLYQALEASAFQGLTHPYQPSVPEIVAPATDAPWAIMRVSTGSAGGFDYGDIYYNDTALPPNNDGVGFRIRKAGTYQITCQATFGSIEGNIDPADFLERSFGSIRIKRNDVYASNQTPMDIVGSDVILQGQVSASEIVDDTALTFRPGAPNFENYFTSTVSGSVFLEVGDHIVAEFNAKNKYGLGASGLFYYRIRDSTSPLAQPVVFVTGNSTEIDQGTFFRCKLQSSD